MKRCLKCILPENYPGIMFNHEGICNHCTDHKGRRYLGDDALTEKILSFLKTRNDRNDNYDCILGLSGGRDSSYLIYYLVKRLNLNVLAYSVDNGFIPEQTIQNIKNIATILNVRLHIEKDNHLRSCIKHHLSAWMHKPSPQMVGMLCVGCRLGIDVGLRNIAKRHKIPVIISGATPLEGKGYKENIIRLHPHSTNKYSLLVGYLNQTIRNPRWVLNATSLIIQIKEYYYHYLRGARNTKGILNIAPYWSYIKWNEKEIETTIQNELGWEKHPGIESTWRGDCNIALLKLYLYKKTLGFNDKDDGLSSLIRDNQISRIEALERLQKESEIPEEVINEFLGKLGLDVSDIKRALESGSFMTK